MEQSVLTPYIEANELASQKTMLSNQLESLNALLNEDSIENMSVEEKVKAFQDSFAALSSAIELEQVGLNQSLEQLDQHTLDVSIKKNIIGIVKKSSIEESISNVYADLKSYLQICGKALRGTNTVLIYSLKLNLLMAKVEQELYMDMDDQLLSGNELKEILLDWLTKQGIHDNEVRELLKSSFQRAYTLRDRLNTFRQEYKSSIASCEKKLLEFESKHDSLDTEIEKIIIDFSNKLQNALDNDIDILSQTYKEKHSSLLSLSNEQISKMQDILKDYNTLVKNHEIKTNRLINEFVQSRDEAIKIVHEQAKQASIQIKSAQIEIEDNVKTTNETLNGLVYSLRTELEAFRREQSEIFEEERKKISDQLKRTVSWIVIASISLSTILSYIFSHLL